MILQLVDSERNENFNKQSEAAAKKSEIDNKIKTLTDQLNECQTKTYPKFNMKKKNLTQ